MTKKKDIKVKFDTLNKSNKSLRFIDFGEPKSNQAILIFFKDGSMEVLSNTNRNGGVCDDCEADFVDDKVVSWQIVSFE